MSDNAALKALKTRRRPRGANTRPTPEQMVEQREAGTPPMQRSMPFLFDPAEMPVVVESGGHVPPADFKKYFVIAEYDASRSFRTVAEPPSCARSGCVVNMYAATST
jgi:hypothetical protein